MRIYQSATGQDEEIVGYPHLLRSYALDQSLNVLELYTPESLMIDSGAYSVWTKGHALDLRQYTSWALDLQARLNERVISGEQIDLRFVNLDVIPGRSGRRPTREEVEAATVDGMRNADAMRAAGVEVSEVYHLQEPLDVLDTLLDRRPAGTLVSVGGFVGTPYRVKVERLDAIWRAVFARAARAGRPLEVPPIHMLGVSAPKLLLRYPWWSSDSSDSVSPTRWNMIVDTQAARWRKMPRDQWGREHAWALATQDVLRSWRRLEGEATELWDRRRVTFEP